MESYLDIACIYFSNIVIQFIIFIRYEVARGDSADYNIYVYRSI